MTALTSRFIALSHWRLLVVALIATMGLALVSPRPASVQEVPPSALAVHVALPNALAVQFLTAIEGNLPAFMLSTGSVLHTPEGTFTGMTGPAQFGEELKKSFSNVQFATNSVVQTSDGFVIASFTLTGINTGSYRGMEAHCAAIAVSGAAFFRLSEESIVDDSWVSLPRDQRNSIPVYETATVVAEEWVNYDADVVASQIAAFNEIDPNIRPGCSESSNAAANVPAIAGSSSRCPVASVCALP